MTKAFKISLIFLLISSNSIFGQTSNIFGLRDNPPEVFAFDNARIMVSSGNILFDGTILIRDGLIENVGQNIDIPDDAWVFDLEGKYIYPGFIELYSDIGMPSIDKRNNNNNKSDANSRNSNYSGNYPGASKRGAYHNNPHVRSWYEAAGQFKPEKDKAQKMRSQGFTVAHTIPPYGIFKGNTAVVSLGEGSGKDLVIKSNVAQAISFDISPELQGDYPTSLMGVIALIRQTFHDTDWFLDAHKVYYEDPVGMKQPEINFAFASLIEAYNRKQPVIISARDEIASLRAENIANEFDLKLWLKASGKEYRRLNAFVDIDYPIIVPVDFPEKPEVDNFEKTIELSLESLMHWELAPENPARIYKEGIDMIITSDGTWSSGEFLKQLRLTVKRGLPEYAAIDALTINPARLLQIDEKYGTLEKGKKANFFIADGNIFEPETKIEEVWIGGRKYSVEKPHELTAQGKWQLSVNDTSAYILELKGEVGNYQGKLIADSKEYELKNAKFDKQRITFMAKDVFDVDEEVIRFSGQVSEESIYGIGERSSGEFFNWKAEKIDNMDDDHKPEKNNENEDEDEAEEQKVFSCVLRPPMEYGLTEKPKQVDCLHIKNVTIWTQSEQGILKKGDILVSNGKIKEVGKNIDPPSGCRIIDASGKHLTPGLIDPHLHTSISGRVNETGNAIVSETRVKDVLNPNNIWIYRLLAGGLTTANLLHGSANPIGGQDAVVKMRWGSLPREMIFEEAKPGLKMALGENVKAMQNRYPDTRMGTEQIIRDAFSAAIDYKTKRDKKQQKGLPYRKDIQLEVLLEVLEGERVVHAHAYRHDEMQMLIRLAEEFGFTIRSFEHTVEGYKIADVLAEHGAAAIVWTDWSSFKMEAYDAIIYNARLLNEQGVLTSLHSDNTRLATRMHWEAGKIAGTGVKEIEAMNMITINPAKILGVDHLVGSIEEGKHADFVIWSQHPLNGFAYAEQTWIDGRKYFDRKKDRETLKEVLKLKNNLTNKVLENN